MAATDKREFCRNVLKSIAVIILAANFLNAIPSKSTSKISPTFFAQKNEPSKFLREIYDEVQELGRHGNDEFVKREFHLNLDGNESNKEEHVLVLNHFSFGHEVMLLQVTYFESRRKNSPVKYAKMIREIECFVLDRGIEIRRCDYNRTEIGTLLPIILQGIRETKKDLYLVR